MVLAVAGVVVVLVEAGAVALVEAGVAAPVVRIAEAALAAAQAAAPQIAAPSGVAILVVVALRVIGDTNEETLRYSGNPRGYPVCQ